MAQRTLISASNLDAVLQRAADATEPWRRTPLAERCAHAEAFVAAMLADVDTLARELTVQMGRPVSQTPGEIRGMADRATTMIRLADEGLADVRVGEKVGFTRFIRREPLGVALVLAPWNYPYLTAVNAVVPAILAGNPVVLKHSDQTPLVAERFDAAWRAADLPPGVFQFVHASHDRIGDAVADPRVAYVAFTGSVEGGRAVHARAGGTFKAVGLELGGKDPAYVRADADLDHAVANLVDGAFFNAGQSCCGIERIYVHRDLYRDFVTRYATAVHDYRLGNPLDPDTNLGPVARRRDAARIRAAIAEAIEAGARPLIDDATFPAAASGTPYVAPQVLVDVRQDMPIMQEETFGPVVGIAPVDGDDAAIAAMNDSAFGLTASVWTTDEEAALAIGDRVETGTFFMNRCDALDPELAWVGIKHSGRGCTLSRVGYEYLTRPKSFHLRTTI